MTDPLVADEPGRRELLLGNEAIVRGAVEAGVRLVSGYPGTPASEIGDSFARIHRRLGIDFEYSVNEKIAIERAFGASLAGARALVSMKHLGLNYGADPLSTMPYIGVVGGLVIVSAGDPGCLTSPNEQDQRHLGRMVGLPTIDPATPEEARRLTRLAFELSEECELPVLLRTTTRLAHTRAPVELGPRDAARPTPAFRRDPARFIPTPLHAPRMRERLHARLARAAATFAAEPWTIRTGPARGPRGVVAGGTPRTAVREALARTGGDGGTVVPFLELAAVHPLPEDVVAAFLASVDEVLVIEELSPFLEDELSALAHRRGLAVRVRGKRDHTVPWFFELEPATVEDRVRTFLGLPQAEIPGAAADGTIPTVPPRPPVLCAGCPHRNAFHAITAVFGEEPVYVNDIGCYTLGAMPPHRAGDVLLAMGSSVPMAAGIARVTGRRSVAFLGDSTFFHSGMPPLLDAVERNDDVVVVVLDNHVTAMTGLQPAPRRAIADVARTLGAKDVQTADATDLPGLIGAFGRAKAARGLSVVVVEGPCALLTSRELTPGNGAARGLPAVDAARCHTCGMSEAGLHCGLAPSLAVERRVATQRAQADDAGETVPATSPCSLECPVGICIPAYVGAAAAGDPARALAAVTLRAALPSVCAYVCHRPCEDACVLAKDDTPIAVNAIKRYLTDGHLRAPAERRDPPTGPAVAVVGGGPAGLAAARELVRRGYAPTVFDAHDRPGGMLELAIPDYRLPRDVVRRDVDAVLAEGVRFEGGVRLGRDFTIEGLRARGFAAVLLALGAQRATRPAIRGADLPDVEDALSFLTAPSPLDGSRVVVVGGGDVGIDAARTAFRRGAASVTLVFPETEAEMAAAPDTVDLARAEGVAFRPGHAATAVRAGDDGRPAAVEIGRVTGFRRAADGSVSWKRTDPAGSVTANHVLFATGQRPDVAGIDLPDGVAGDAGRLASDDFGRTAVPWLFAAGDVATGPSTVTQALAAGVRAAWAIDVFLDEALHLGRDVPPAAAPLPRSRDGHGHGHADARSRAPASLDDRAAVAEARRCLLCGMCRNCDACVELFGCPAIARDARGGQPRVVAELCTACGACVQVCPNDAIRAAP